MGEPPVHSNNEFKSVKQPVYLSRLFSFLKSSIRPLKVSHKSRKTEFAVNTANADEKKRESDHYISQGTSRSYTSFTVR